MYTQTLKQNLQAYTLVKYDATYIVNGKLAFGEKTYTSQIYLFRI